MCFWTTLFLWNRDLIVKWSEWLNNVLTCWGRTSNVKVLLLQEMKWNEHDDMTDLMHTVSAHDYFREHSADMTPFQLFSFSITTEECLREKRRILNAQTCVHLCECLNRRHHEARLLCMTRTLHDNALRANQERAARELVQSRKGVECEVEGKKKNRRRGGKKRRERKRDVRIKA